MNSGKNVYKLPVTIIKYMQTSQKPLQQEEELVHAIKEEMTTIKDAEKANRHDYEELKHSMDKLQESVSNLEHSIETRQQGDTQEHESSRLPHTLKIRRRTESKSFWHWLWNNHEV